MIDGIVYLLAREQRGLEYVCRYNADEMDELFTRDEWQAFVQGEVVERYGVRYVCMVQAARAAL